MSISQVVPFPIPSGTSAQVKKTFYFYFFLIFNICLFEAIIFWSLIFFLTNVQSLYRSLNFLYSDKASIPRLYQKRSVDSKVIYHIYKALLVKPLVYSHKLSAPFPTNCDLFAVYLFIYFFGSRWPKPLVRPQHGAVVRMADPSCLTPTPGRQSAPASTTQPSWATPDSQASLKGSTAAPPTLPKD